MAESKENSAIASIEEAIDEYKKRVSEIARFAYVTEESIDYLKQADEELDRLLRWISIQQICLRINQLSASFFVGGFQEYDFMVIFKSN